jgi:hypothetical protein
MEESDDSTLIQFDFHPKVEGIAWHACDRIIYGFLSDVHTSIGVAEEINAPGKAARPVPPWWLIAVTVLGLVSFCGSVAAHFADCGQKRQDISNARSEQSMRDEITAWTYFKERYNLR